jgi:predicted nucleic acid-binding protein
MATTVFYLDSSAAVKRYVNEPGTPWMQSICDHPDNALALAQIGLVEIAAGLASKHRQGLLRTDLYEGLLLDLRRDARDQYLLVDIDQAIVDQAMQLTRLRKLRGYDAVHLACALFLNGTLTGKGLPALTLLSADRELLAAASDEGLPADDPNSHF